MGSLVATELHPVAELDDRTYKPPLRAYIFADDLFAWVMVIIASSEEEAREFGGFVVVGAVLGDVKNFRPGILAEGGGNG